MTEDPRPATSAQFCPAQDSGGYDASELIGLDLEAASEQAKAHRCSLRVVEEDGKHLAVTDDLRTDRINVEVSDGEVVRVDGIY